MTRRNTGAMRGATLLVLLGALTAFAPMSIDMYLPTLPTLRVQLATDAAMVQLTLVAYFIGLAGGQLVYGPAADRFGRKPVLAAGICLYVAASAGCALAGSIGVLIACRLLQALGGCVGIVIARTVVRDLFDQQQSARVFSILMLVMGVAPIAAPLAGGWLLAMAGWRSIFWVLAGFGLTCLVATAVFLPETRRPSVRGVPVGGIARLYGRVFRQPVFRRAVLAGGLAQAGMFAYIAGSPFVFIELHHVPAAAYGWLFGANAFGLIAASQGNRWLLSRMPAPRLLGIGIAIAAASGAALLAVALGQATGLAWIAVPLFVYVASLGLVMPNAVAIAMRPFPDDAGSASGLLGSIQFAFAAVAGTAVGWLGEGSALPMAAVMAGCGLSSLAVLRFLTDDGDVNKPV